MTFLALAPFQAALLALFTAGAIVALYFIKIRQRRVVVASSLLWQRMIARRQEQSLWERLRRYLSMLLALIIGLSMAFAVARPDIPWLTGGSERVVIVLDTSPTMLARTPDGRTRWEHAVEMAHSLVDSFGAAASIRIADTSGRFESPAAVRSAELREWIDAMQPVILPVRFPAIDDAAARVYFISDGVAGAAAPENAISLSVFEAAPNAGITAFEVRPAPSDPTDYEAYLEVRNFGDDARNVEIGVGEAGGNVDRLTHTVRLESGESFRAPFDLSDFSEGPVRVAIRSEDDAFALDDAAYAYLPSRRSSRILLVTTGNRYLETLLQLHAQIELATVRPEDFRDDGAFDAYIFDRFAPASPPSRPALIVAGGSVPEWLGRAAGTASNPSFEEWIEDHPVMRNVSLHDVAIERAVRMETATAVAVASSAGAPLVLASDDPRWLFLTFDLHASNLPFHAAFPAFMDNVLAWLGREPAPLYRTAGLVEAPVAAAEVRQADGTPVAAHRYMGQTVFDAFDPGIYIAGNGSDRTHVAVNFANREYSDINRTSMQSRNGGPGLWTPGRELWVYLVCGALLLIGAEWWTYHRRITL